MNLRSLRIMKSMKQEELASKIGVSPSMISRYERGLSIPPADKVVLLARYLNTTVDSIIGESNDDIPIVEPSPLRNPDSSPAVLDDTLVYAHPDFCKTLLDWVNGTCELCGASFKQKDFLEIHYVKWLKDGGEPKITNAVALCPNCHKKIHMEQNPEDLQLLREKAVSHRTISQKT